MILRHWPTLAGRWSMAILRVAAWRRTVSYWLIFLLLLIWHSQRVWDIIILFVGGWFFFHFFFLPLQWFWTGDARGRKRQSGDENEKKTRESNLVLSGKVALFFNLFVCRHVYVLTLISLFLFEVFGFLLLVFKAVTLKLTDVLEDLGLKTNNGTAENQ